MKITKKACEYVKEQREHLQQPVRVVFQRTYRG